MRLQDEEFPRVLELADRLTMSGPKAAHVSASETHEIADAIRDLVAEVRQRRATPPPAAPLALAPEQRSVLEWSRKTAERELNFYRDNSPRMAARLSCYVAVLDRLLAASPSHPVAPAEQLRTLLIQKRADLAWAYQSVTAARASRYHAGADVTRDDEVRETLATLESIATAPGAATPPAGEPMTVAMALMLPEVRSGEKWIEWTPRLCREMQFRFHPPSKQFDARPKDGDWQRVALVALSDLDQPCTLVDPEPAKEGA